MPHLCWLVLLDTSLLRMAHQIQCMSAYKAGPMEVQRITLPFWNLPPREETKHMHTTSYRQLEEKGQSVTLPVERDGEASKRGKGYLELELGTRTHQKGSGRTQN